MPLAHEMHRIFCTAYIYDLEQKVAYLAEKIIISLNSTIHLYCRPYKLACVRFFIKRTCLWKNPCIQTYKAQSMLMRTEIIYTQ